MTLFHENRFFHSLYSRRTRYPDVETLANHMLDMGQQATCADIVRKCAASLEQLADCRLFAFALKKDQNIDVWIDGQACDDPLKTTITSDFNDPENNTIHLMDPGLVEPVQPNDEITSRLTSLEISDDNSYCRVYFVPARQAVKGSRQMIHLLLRACTQAVLKQSRLDMYEAVTMTDPLTGCCNKKEFHRQLERCMAAALRHVSDLSLILFDLDDFTVVLDESGNLAGDRVLKEVALLAQSGIRQEDLLARTSRDRFAVILPGTGKREAAQLADRLRQDICRAVISFGAETIRVTASFGVAELNHESAVPGQFEKNAADMLHKAKLQGKNLVMPGLMRVCPPDWKGQEACSGIPGGVSIQ